MATTQRKPRKSAAANPVAADINNIEVTEIQSVNETAPIVQAVSKARDYQPEDLITCRSVTPGELLYPSKKTGMLYTWSDCGDTTDVMYQDLYTLMVSKSKYLFAPLFIIADEELLENPKWKSLKTFYDGLYTKDDVRDILRLPTQQFKNVFKALPDSFKNTIKIEVATQIERGTFDSIQKVRIIDEICHSDLACLL